MTHLTPEATCHWSSNIPLTELGVFTSQVTSQTVTSLASCPSSWSQQARLNGIVGIPLFRLWN